MKDPVTRSFPIYLPPEYSKKRREPYPVFFLLAGWGGRGTRYTTDHSVFETPLHERLDQAISGKKMPPVIAVFVDGSSKYGCSQYVNSSTLGNYSDYICDELTSFVDSHYHTHADAEHRGILGHSSGGFGALVQGFLRPDRFAYEGSSAGDSFFEINTLPDIKDCLIELQRAGGVNKFLASVFASDESLSQLGGKKMHALMTLSGAACYAPNPQKAPLYGDLFFDEKTGEILPEIWKKWSAWDPVNMIDRVGKTLPKKLKFVLLEAGLQDEFGLQWGHRQLAQKLKKFKIPHEISEYPGAHGGHHWRFLGRIERLLKAMA